MENKITCSFDGCDRPRKNVGSGLCARHAIYAFRGEELKPLRASVRQPKECSVDGCTRRPATISLCHLHYDRWRKHGDPGKPGPRVTGDTAWKYNGNGYLGRRTIVDGREVNVLQHRVVVEEAIGRKLLPHENIHHINGVRDDNRWPENLEIWNTSQPPGQRLHEKLSFYREMLRQYGFTVELTDPEALGIDPNLLN